MQVIRDTQVSEGSKKKMLLDGAVFTFYGAFIGGAGGAINALGSAMHPALSEKLLEGTGTGMLIAGAASAAVLLRELKRSKRN
ncbi:MAG: hypothetical protein M1520_02020 [Candidatus Marsarchaeota archaeon]|jgi:hypothetical protein|nr:hypothetical protein [Candidatus Marsarchaeota archaeon]